MKAKLWIAAAAWVILILVSVLPAVSAEKSLLKELELSEFDGVKLKTEINLPQGAVKEVAEQMAPLGLSDVKQISVLVFSVEAQADAKEIFEFYEPSIAKKDWEPIIRSLEDDRSLAILVNEKSGLFVVQIDPPGAKDREMTMMRILGKVDPAKIGKLPGEIEFIVPDNGGTEAVGSSSKIPIDAPISVPPAQKLRLIATKSDIEATLKSGNTVEISLDSPTANPGELARVDNLLVLTLASKLKVDEISLPSGSQLVLELTDGSLTLDADGEKPEKLFVTTTGAPVTIEGLPLTTGTHSVETVGSKINITLAKTDGGTLEIEATGGDITLALPKDASAKVSVSVTSGKIDNRTGTEPAEKSDDKMELQMGAGKATISLKAVNGAVCIKLAD